MTMIDKAEALAAVDANTPAPAGGPFSHTNSMRVVAADIRRAIAALPARGVGVKPLDWHEGDEPDEWKSGPYDVWCELGKFQLYYWAIVLGEPHETADAAKAAAYAHHRARILAALSEAEAGQ